MPESTALTSGIVPAPLDALAIPATLDGRDGANRATGRHAQIAATDDLDALRGVARALHRYENHLRELPQGSRRVAGRS